MHHPRIKFLMQYSGNVAHCHRRLFFRTLDQFNTAPIRYSLFNTTSGPLLRCRNFENHSSPWRKKRTSTPDLIVPNKANHWYIKECLYTKAAVPRIHQFTINDNFTGSMESLECLLWKSFWHYGFEVTWAAMILALIFKISCSVTKWVDSIP